MHCQRKAKKAVRGHGYVVKAEKYLVIDIGGGTVDIEDGRGPGQIQKAGPIT